MGLKIKMLIDGFLMIGKTFLTMGILFLNLWSLPLEIMAL